ncbi:MAG: fibronectin type III domain-containing protein [Prevotella sp.]
MKRIFIIMLAVFALNTVSLCAQSHQEQQATALLEQRLQDFFLRYKAKGTLFPQQPRMERLEVNDDTRHVRIVASSYFAMQEFTQASVRSIYRKVSRAMPSPYSKYSVEIVVNGMAIEQLAVNGPSGRKLYGAWGNIDYDGQPWVSRISATATPTHGLYNRHIALWASHGMYYDQSKGYWKWQRPNLFGTTEDLFTQTIVVPFLIPMLENAGANVFTPRERDWQKEEVIVDNDDSPRLPHYLEMEMGKEWETADVKGFARHDGTYRDSENPFEAGTVRRARTTKKKNGSEISYQPSIPEEGDYAVYVSYATVPGSIPDAEYTVYHKGQVTRFHVNQQMGGSTWVYLGTFRFDKGCSEFNRVVVSNRSEHKGVVTADAVRFGGGMGNIQRGGTVSGMPRCLEASRYYAQWAGAPYSVYSGKMGTDDYTDDINVRSNMTNWLAGGSVYVPSLDGKNVPIELSLAVHSDAGVAYDGHSFIGSLGICTTDFNGGRLNSGISRLASRDFADELLSGLQRDLTHHYRTWTRRDLYDRNYSETRKPEMPSAIIETLSHQNFPDMLMGHDPNFKFTMARSIYKSILRYVCQQHSRPYIVQPLAPNGFSVTMADKGRVKLSWTPTTDELEPTAYPTAYNVYMATGNGGFDNGTMTTATTLEMEIEPNTVYHFRVTAMNRGGESFPTETLSAYCNPDATKTVLVVNGFKRLAGPAVVNTIDEQGFDLDADMGVSYGLTAGWNGRQTCFDRKRMGTEGPGALGYGEDEMAGKFIMGNTFDYVTEHATSIASSARYNIVSCGKEAIETGKVNLSDYDSVDLILGLEKDDGHALAYYKSVSPQLQQKLTAYAHDNGRMLVSGAYMGSDIQDEAGKQFLRDVLKVECTSYNDSVSHDTVSGLGRQFRIIRNPNPHHYAASAVDRLSPAPSAYCAMLYQDGSSAAVAYDGNDYKCFTMGFPIECIANKDDRTAIINGILAFIMK